MFKYSSNYLHRRGIILPLLAFLAIPAYGTWLASGADWLEGNRILMYSVFSAAAVLAFGVARCFRRHEWEVEQGGVRIRERNVVPLTGFGRRAFVRYDEITALNEISTDHEMTCILVTRDGRRFALDHAMKRIAEGKYGRLVADEDKPLGPFIGQIERRVAESAAGPADTSRLLGHTQSIAGLVMIGALFLIFLTTSGWLLWALVDALMTGKSIRTGTSTRPHGTLAGAAATAIILTLVTGWLFRTSLRQRREVLGKR